MKAAKVRGSFLAGFLFFSLTCFADEPRASEPVEQVVARIASLPEFPGVEYIIESFQGRIPTIQELSALYPDQVRTLMARLGTIPEAGPDHIARLELAYPGATWAALGRDAVEMGVFLESFYHYVGQKGRVRYIQASGGTFRSDRALFPEFLQEMGMEFTPEGRPFVILDRTSYGASSQSTSLLRIAYDHFEKLGIPRQKLIRRIGVMSATAGHTEAGRSTVEEYFADVEEHLRFAQRQNASHEGIPHRILSVSSGLTDGPVWHSGYGGLQRDASGKVHSSLGEHSTDGATSIVVEVLLAYNLVARPDFIERVKEAARNYGYEFDLVTPDPEVLAARLEEARQLELRRIEEFKKSEWQKLRDMFEGMPPRTQRKQRYFSDNASFLAKWLDSTARFADAGVSNDLIIMFLDFVPRVLEAQKIGERDTRRLVAKALSLVRYNEKFRAQMTEVLKQNPELVEIFSEKAWSFYSPATKNVQSVTAVFDLIRNEILAPMNCQFNLVVPVRAPSGGSQSMARGA